MDQFQTYYGYIGNYKTALDTVLKCKNANHQFKDIMEQVNDLQFTKCLSSFRERILTSHFADCEAYFINCEVILLDFLNFAKQTFLIFDLI